MKTARLVPLLAVSVVAACLAPAGSASASALHHRTQLLPVAAHVSGLSLHDDVGDISVLPGKTAKVRVIEQYNYAAPTITHTLSHGILTVGASCPPNGILALGLDSCSVDLALTVPRSVTVDAVDSVGDIRTRDLHGAESLRTDVGHIVVDRVVATRIQAVTSAGSVRLRNVRAAVLSGRSATGEVSITADSMPRSLTAHNADGDIALTVPSGAYSLTAHSDVGAARVHGITVSGDAVHRIVAATDDGEIRISGR